MMRPRLLDLFCGAGGCAMGYHRAGFDVVGVDIKTQPRYPFEFHQSEALDFLSQNWKAFDVIHASPPCQGYSRSRNNGCHKDAPRMIEVVRDAIVVTDKPFVIENVEGAPMHFPLMLCGASFGLGVLGHDLPRHRLFECSHLILGPACSHRRGKTVGVYGNGTNSFHRKMFGRCITVAEQRIAMGIDWMVRKELTQAIPPAYTEFIGKQLLRAIQASNKGAPQ